MFVSEQNLKRFQCASVMFTIFKKYFKDIYQCFVLMSNSVITNQQTTAEGDSWSKLSYS